MADAWGGDVLTKWRPHDDAPEIVADTQAEQSKRMRGPTQMDLHGKAVGHRWKEINRQSSTSGDETIISVRVNGAAMTWSQYRARQQAKAKALEMLCEIYCMVAELDARGAKPVMDATQDNVDKLIGVCCDHCGGPHDVSDCIEILLELDELAKPVMDTTQGNINKLFGVCCDDCGGPHDVSNCIEVLVKLDELAKQDDELEVQDTKDLDPPAAASAEASCAEAEASSQ